MLTDRRRALAFLLAGVIALGVCTGASAQALYDRFIQAVTLDKTEDVRAMLARGMDPNTVDPNGDPVLLVAARSSTRQDGHRSSTPRPTVTSRSCVISSKQART